MTDLVRSARKNRARSAMAELSGAGAAPAPFLPALFAASIFALAPGRSDDAPLPETAVLSTHGSGRATGYAESSKIVTANGRTHVAWLDSENDRFLVRARTLDRKTGTWSKTVTIGEAHDNHGGPAMTIDSAGYLWVAYGPHHHPMRTARSVRPNDATEWQDAGSIGERTTYPTLVRGPDDLLLLTYRVSYDDAPWEVHLARRKPAGEWEEVTTILRADERGYSHFQEALAWSPDGETLHLGCRFYGGGGRRRGHTVGYLRSKDNGTTWTRSDGAPVSLPATRTTVDVIASAREGKGVGLRSGAIAVDADGRPWILWSDYDVVPPRAFLSSPDAAGGWTTKLLDVVLPAPLEKYGIALPGGIAFEKSGPVTIALTALRPEDGKDETVWGHPTSEVVVIRGPTREGPFEAQIISRPDPERPHWLPSLERPTAPGLLEASPGLLYTGGPRGEGLDDILANEVIWTVVK